MVEHKGVIEMDTMTAVPERVKHCIQPIVLVQRVWDSHIMQAKKKGRKG